MAEAPAVEVKIDNRAKGAGLAGTVVMCRLEWGC